MVVVQVGEDRSALLSNKLSLHNNPTFAAGLLGGGQGGRPRSSVGHYTPVRASMHDPSRVSEEGMG